MLLRERGIEAEEVVATLAQKFAEAGYSNRTEIVDATEFKFVVAVGGGELTVTVRRLPDRRLGPTLRLPRTTTEIACRDIDRGLLEELTELIDRSLIRGGG